MKTNAIRLYGKGDLRLETFELPEIKDDEVLVKIITDTLCMSTYKAQLLGEDHARVPKDVSKNPVMVGHEMCGDIVKVGKKWKDKFFEGTKFAFQPALPNGEMNTVGYAWQYCGGDATYAIIPALYLENDCLLNYENDNYFSGSLAEPMSCIIAGFHVNYHNNFKNHTHIMGTKKGGRIALLASCGPMGLGAIDYALNSDINPKLVVVTDIDESRIKRAKEIFTPENAAKKGISLIYLNSSMDNTLEIMLNLTDNKGYDDVFVYAPVRDVIEQADKLTAFDGCVNFFAGPADKDLSAFINFYNIHYKFSHFSANAGGNTDDMLESLRLSSQGKINPAVMITHIGGLDSAVEATLNLPSIHGGKLLIYTHKFMPLTAINDFAELGKKNKFFADLDILCKKHNNLWNAEAEQYLLRNL